MDDYIRSRINVLWDSLSANGMKNSLESIEQLSYLIFFKRIDTIQIKKEQIAEMFELPVTNPIFDELSNDCRWSVFKTYSAGRLFRHMPDKVFPFVRYNLKITDETSYARYMKDAVFRFSNPSILKEAVALIDELDFDTPASAKETYAFFLTKITPNNDKGQFITPPHLADLMIRLTEPNLEDRISDPAMGTGSLLAAAAQYIRTNFGGKLIDQKIRNHFNSEMFSGIDIDHQMTSIAAMNMILSDITGADLQVMDSLSNNNFHSGEYSLILSNLPFSTATDINYVSESLQSGNPTSNTAILFFRLILRMLKSGGRCVAIIPDVMLFGVRKANMDVKQELISNHRIDAVISLSNAPFFGKTSCSIIVFTKDVPEGTDEVWFYDLTEESDIPDLIARYKHKETEHSRSRYDRSFFVSREEIVNNNYMLIMKRYKKDASLPVHDTARMALQNLEITNSILRNQINNLEDI